MSEKDLNNRIEMASDFAPAEMPSPRLPRPPFWMIGIGLVGVVASWVPLALSAAGRTNHSGQPRISLMQDMGMQAKLREQQFNPVFLDTRSDRPYIPGTVARGHVDEDDQYYRGFHLVHDDATGKDNVTFYRGFPSQITLSHDLLKRGQQRFNIYCTACHGVDGHGHGPVNERALQLASQGAGDMSWTQAADLHSDAVRSREEGNLFNTITNGVRAMPPYGERIPLPDRWAIVAYVRALQFSQNAPGNLLTPEEQNQLK